jgi:hypothetical protein
MNTIFSVSDPIIAINVGDKIKMLDIPEFKRIYHILDKLPGKLPEGEKDSPKYISFTVAVGAIGIITAVHTYFYEVDWEGHPKVTEFTNPVISCSKGWIVAKEYIEKVI